MVYVWVICWMKPGDVLWHASIRIFRCSQDHFFNRTSCWKWRGSFCEESWLYLEWCDKPSQKPAILRDVCLFLVELGLFVTGFTTVLPAVAMIISSLTWTSAVFCLYVTCHSPAINALLKKKERGVVLSWFVTESFSYAHLQKDRKVKKPYAIRLVN